MSKTDIEKSEGLFRLIGGGLDPNDVGFIEDIFRSAVSSGLVSIEELEEAILYEFKDSYFQGDYKNADALLAIGQVVSEYAIELDMNSTSGNFLSTLSSFMGS